MVDATRPSELANTDSEPAGDSIDRMLRDLERTAAKRIHLPTYRTLIEAMADLALEDRVAAQLVCWCYVLDLQDPNTLPMTARWRLVKAVVFLAGRLPARPKLPVEVRQAEDARWAAMVAAKGRWAAPAVRAERDREIRRRFRQGATVTQLARGFGVSRRAVYDVLEAAA